MMLPEAEDSEGEQEREEIEVEDLRSWLPAIYADRLRDESLELDKGEEQQEPEQVQEKEQQEPEQQENDMAHSDSDCYNVIGLSGASGCFPSPFTLVTKGHLAEHATNGLPHN